MMENIYSLQKWERARDMEFALRRALVGLKCSLAVDGGCAVLKGFRFIFVYVFDPLDN